MFEELRGYLQLATGLSEVTAAKAKEAAMALVAHGLSLTTKAPDVVGQVQELADDLVATSRSNREALTSLIRAEVDRNVARMGFVREDELAALRRHVQRLEEHVQRLEGQSTAGAATSPAAPSAPAKAPADPVEAPAVAVDEAAVESQAPVVKKKKKVVVDTAESGSEQ